MIADDTAAKRDGKLEEEVDPVVALGRIGSLLDQPVRQIRQIDDGR